MAEVNATNMINKMNNHFAQWSKRSLSILGKIQIIKTFGLSQFLYALAVVNLLPEHWKRINNLVSKFIWNKNYAGNRAPNRIKNEIIYNEVCNGGFGMVKLEEVTNCIRLRRFAILDEGFDHPVKNLQARLGGNIHLRNDHPNDRSIDPTTTTATKMITEHNVLAYADYDCENLEADRLLRLKLCSTKLISIIPRNKRNSRSATMFRRMGVYTIHELLVSDDVDKLQLLAICIPQLIPLLRKLLTLVHLDHNHDELAQQGNHHLYDTNSYTWLNAAIMPSSRL
jgi:hypothetical protein